MEIKSEDIIGFDYVLAFFLETILFTVSIGCKKLIIFVIRMFLPLLIYLPISGLL